MLCCSLRAWVADTNGARCWRVHTAGLERRRGRWVVFRRWFAAPSAATLYVCMYVFRRNHSSLHDCLGLLLTRDGTAGRQLRRWSIRREIWGCSLGTVDRSKRARLYRSLRTLPSARLPASRPSVWLSGWLAGRWPVSVPGIVTSSTPPSSRRCPRECARGMAFSSQCAVLCVANVVIDARDSRRAFSLVSQVFALVVAAREKPEPEHTEHYWAWSTTEHRDN